MSNDNKPDEHGPAALHITNEVNGRAEDLHANLDWKMEKVREHAYKVTKDEPRASDRFTGSNPNTALTPEQLQLTLAQLTGPHGAMSGERNFHIHGAVGGA